MYYTVFNAPIGDLYIVEHEGNITHVFLDDDHFSQQLSQAEMIAEETPLLIEAKKQLKEYFAGQRKTFSLPLKQSGTIFQEQVWEALASIPYGQSRSYVDIARAIGNPKAVRAIGQANRRNALPVFIPCHRVIGKDRSLTGYAGTRTDTKAILLDLEGIPFVKK
ncbi:methylated-DNA--[protein]-cysteine S-methyltransferase [Bacillus sp. NPDC077027]|uniref:methylated-DNA--[protein]-cysteine S-methyltransferase n=1 Tax=Bacillus sp. NPDC077027 TaxID=3390548 RepID=UPI003D07F1C9